MSNNLIHIDQRDLVRLDMNMRQFERSLMLVSKKALSAVGLRIIAQAQAALRRMKNIASGLLVNNGSVKEGADNSILAGFSTIYAYYVEFGRRAGKWPPFRAIYEWVRIKHFAQDDKEAKKITFLIRRKIGKHGTKPHPFLKPAYEKNKHLIIAILRKSAAAVMNKDYTK